MQKNYIFIYNLNNRVYIRTDSIYLSELQNIFESREAAEEEIMQTNTCKNPFHDKDVYSVSLYSFFFFFIVKSYLNNVRTRRHNNDEPFKVTRGSFRKSVL